MKKIIMLLVIYPALALPAFSQKSDTIMIDASKIDTKVLIPGTHRYLVYGKSAQSDHLFPVEPDHLIPE
ncbi:MAG: hypothetical protein HYZ15_14715 [Sphingobacteriales bacterium]|nr:hypothetical protein [Sphingobacteriales bacterium]